MEPRASQKENNNVLEFNKRLELLQKVEEGKKSQADIARDFNVDPAVISRLKKNTEKLKGKLAKASGDIRDFVKVNFWVSMKNFSPG